MLVPQSRHSAIYLVSAAYHIAGTSRKSARRLRLRSQLIIGCWSHRITNGNLINPWSDEDTTEELYSYLCITSQAYIILAWDAKITESGKFKIGYKDNAFCSKRSRNEYIRLLNNGFSTFKDVSFQQHFDPLNGYANFQTLLNMVQVPIDHIGFYKNDQKKLHLSSQFLSSPAN